MDTVHSEIILQAFDAYGPHADRRGAQRCPAMALLPCRRSAPEVFWLTGPSHPPPSMPCAPQP
jgi:hypothetical protein